MERERLFRLQEGPGFPGISMRGQLSPIHLESSSLTTINFIMKPTLFLLSLATMALAAPAVKREPAPQPACLPPFCLRAASGDASLAKREPSPVCIKPYCVRAAVQALAKRMPRPQCLPFRCLRTRTAAVQAVAKRVPHPQCTRFNCHRTRAAAVDAPVANRED